MDRCTDHGRQRAGERLGKAGRRRAVQLFAWLWQQGRPADDSDFLVFGTKRLRGRLYRVAMRGTTAYMVVRDAESGAWITLFKRPR